MPLECSLTPLTALRGYSLATEGLNLMRYRVLGKTKLKLSVLGFGGSPLGGSFGPVDTTDATRAVHAALAGGINFFDTAPLYGNSEEVLGNALASTPRDKYVLASKVGRYGLDSFDFSMKHTIASVEESLRRLNTDHLDLVQCHDIEFGDLDQVVNETIPALQNLKKTGKVRFVGVTGYPLKIFWYVLEKIDVDVVASYCHYTLNDTLLTELMPYVQSKRVGLLNAAPHGMGLMTGGDLPDWHPAPQVLRDTCKAAADFCQTKNYPLADLALKFAVDRSEITSTITGMRTAAEVEHNIAAIERSPPPGLFKDVEKILAPVKDKVWVSGRVENN